MKLSRHSQQGLSLVEIAFALVVFSVVATVASFGVRAVANAKIRAMVIQMTQYKTAATAFQKQYGTWPGDFAQARERLHNCNDARQCENGNGDQIVASAIDGNCRMPPDEYDKDILFPCTQIGGGSGNETVQFWRHLVLADMIDGLTLRNRYRWGDSLPKLRITGGLQVLYNADINHFYVKGLTGHFLVHQRTPTMFHRNFEATGDGVTTPMQSRMVDREIDDGFPNTGMLRTTGGWGCGTQNPDPAAYSNDYGDTNHQQCTMLYKFDP